MLRIYIDGLYKHLEKVEKEREQAKESAAAELQTSMQPSVKPLEQQLIGFFRSLPPSRAEKPLLMSDIIHHLRGRYRDKPHAQQVATELRKLGWQRRRLYGAEWAGRRYWFPPA